MHELQLGSGGRAGHGPVDPFPQTGGLDALEDRSEAVGTLRVTAAEVVVEVPLVGQQEDGHASGTIGAATTVARMTGHRILSGADARLRVAPWRGDASTAHLLPGRSKPTATSISRTLDELADSDYRAALTAALPPADQRLFLDAGFEVHERLHLLVRGIDDIPHPQPTPAELRRGHHGDRPRILAVDAAAFPPFWQLDAAGLEDAVAATPSARLRVAVGVGLAATHRRLRRHGSGGTPGVPPAARRRPARAG